MRLSPETIAAHRARHARERRYPVHNLAPDPREPELPLQPGCGCADCKRRIQAREGQERTRERV